jgi:hypothetical protein
VLANARLINQSGTSIVASHEQTLVIAGLHIARAANATGPTILAYWSGHQNNAQLSINDCVPFPYSICVRSVCRTCTQMSIYTLHVF